MAEQRDNPGNIDVWQVLATFFGYFAVAKDVPAVLRILDIPKLMPGRLKHRLLQWNNHPEFWLLAFFTTSVLLISLFLLPRKKISVKEKDKDVAKGIKSSGELLSSEAKEEMFADTDRITRRSKLIRYVRTLGFAYLRDKLLDCLHVALYGTFRWPNYWPQPTIEARYVDRILFEDGRGVEFKYAKNSQYLIVREHQANENTYGDPAMRAPTGRELLLLLIASDYFPFWFPRYLLAALAKRVFG